MIQRKSGQPPKLASINIHIKSVLSERELQPAATIKEDLIVRISGENAQPSAIDLATQIVRNDEARLELLRSEKKALMQQLLTGKRRFRLPAEAKAIPA